MQQPPGKLKGQNSWEQVFLYDQFNNFGSEMALLGQQSSAFEISVLQKQALGNEITRVNGKFN